MKSGNLWKAGKAAIVALGVLALMGYAQAQRGPGKGTPKYDPSTEVAVKGTVLEVSEHTSPMGWPGTHLTVKTSDGTLDVHLGPASYLAEKKFSFSKGDGIEVTGSKIKFDGGNALLAREVKKGDHTLALRNKEGIPLWSRSRRR